MFFHFNLVLGVEFNELSYTVTLNGGETVYGPNHTTSHMVLIIICLFKIAWIQYSRICLITDT